MRLMVAAGLAWLLAGSMPAAHADSLCRPVEISFDPVPRLQIAVWIEDASGHYVDTAYVTRLTGTLGLANRPGDHLFKSDFRWPYGRRDMVLPVWAHARNHHYGLVVMGGLYGNSVASCTAKGTEGSNCDDETIGYHYTVSSPEPFYCSPTGGVGGLDATSCASAFYGSKGAYADPPAFSFYPPRADLTMFVPEHDGPDAMGFAKMNDLGAISGATPQGNAIIDPPVRWTAGAAGSYVLKVEVSLENDVNASYDHPAIDDEHSELNAYGRVKSFGQPSVVYAVPFQVGPTRQVFTSDAYAGYGDWDGATGALHPPDATITDKPGSGAGRLLAVTDSDGTWRVKVEVGAPVSCAAPYAPSALTATPHQTSIDLGFTSNTGGPAVARYDVRYRESSPISDDNFLSSIPSSTPPPQPGAPGTHVTTTITGLRPLTTYYIGVRTLSADGTASPVATAQATTSQQQFVTLHGCFIATAAFGSPLAKELGPLRRLRDRVLLESALGRLGVATYYIFSPPVAGAISTDERLRAGARVLVRPLVLAAQRAVK